MKIYATTLIALVILVVSGFVHGVWAERWNPATALQDAAARVENVPWQIGDWKALAMDADPGTFMQAGAQKYWARSYTNAKKNASLLVILMCGRAGRMAVHTPEMCYRGAGYIMEGKPEVLTVPSALDEKGGTFWTARFSKETGLASDLRLFWSWNAGKSWQASPNPRWEFGGEPFLYKLYLSLDTPGPSEQATEVALEFLKEFLPELHKTLGLEPSSH